MLFEVQRHRYLKTNKDKHLVKPSSIKADHGETLTDHTVLLGCGSVEVCSEGKCSGRLSLKTLGH